MKSHYSVKYPDKLKHYSQTSTTSDLYISLFAITAKHVSQLTNHISEQLMCYPEIIRNIDRYQLHGIIEEIVKNIFDSVNNAKATNLNIDSIEIKLSIQLIGDKIQIKISDNGAGFERLDKSKKTTVSQYINSRKQYSFFPFLNNNNKTEIINSTKFYDRQLGKGYLIGGEGLGLSEINNIIKKCHGTVLVKNRKEQGASIEITLPLNGKDISQPIVSVEKIFEDAPLIKEKLSYRKYGTF